jgi:large subunit ribosomal protein L15
MDLSRLKPNTPRKSQKRVGRGGKRGFTSGHGTKGQKGRAGASVKPGFRGADNRLWQLFPKQRGASKKPGNSSIHVKHRFFQLKHDKLSVVNMFDLNKFKSGETITPEILLKAGLVYKIKKGVKVLGNGELKTKLNFAGLAISKTARAKIEKLGGTIN